MRCRATLKTAITNCFNFSFFHCMQPIRLHSPAVGKILGYSRKQLVKIFTSSKISALHRPSHGKYFSSLVQFTTPQNRCLRRDRDGRCGTCICVLRHSQGVGDWLSTCPANSFFSQNSRRSNRSRLSLLSFICRCFRTFQCANGEHLLELPSTRATRQSEISSAA